ncbi:MAG: nitroreductase family protein [Propionibacteriaceae bacterium]|jgi:nitroreductase|nr:nitroreductase family protein [Propionibacteriaceae bacterium]
MNTSDTIAVIARRHSCRAFQSTPVAADTLKVIAEAGVRSPSAVNRQPWHLTVVTDQADLQLINDAGLANLKAFDQASFDRIQARGGRLLYGAPAMIIISTKAMSDAFPVSMDAGIVAATVTLAATSLGLDSCIAALPGLAFQTDQNAALRDKLIPAGHDFAVAVLLGYGVKPGAAPHEPDFAKISYA